MHHRAKETPTFPKLLLACLLATPGAVFAAPCDTAYNGFNGPRSLFLNLQNCGTACANQELPYLELIKDGLSGVRIGPVPSDRAQPGEPAFYLVNPRDPYLEAVLETFGPENVLVLLDDGVDSGPFAKPTPEQMLLKLRSLIETHPSVRKIEFMNEPANFSDVRPAEYVALYLRPARQLIDEFNRFRPFSQRLLLYSAAWFGNQDGVRETQRMVRAGALGLVDVLSAHVYADREDEAVQLAAEYKRLARGKPVAITETNFNRGNASQYESQLWWICRSMSSIEETLRRRLSPQDEALQHNVLYTLRGDEARRFNLINFPDQRRPTFWQATGPGHSVLSARSDVPTDPKPGAGDPEPPPVPPPVPPGGGGTGPEPLGSGPPPGF